MNEIYGERPGEKIEKPAQDQPAESKPSPQGFLRKLMGTGVAHAGQDIDVSTPEIRAIKESMKARAGRVLLVDPQPAVQKVFDIVKATDVNEVFRSVKELDEYLDAMQKRASGEDPED